MKYLYITIIFLIFAVPVVNSCIPSPMGPSNPAITGCQATVAANLSLTLFPCGREGEVIVRSQADYISKLCLDPANPSPPAPCDFSAYMLVGEPLGGGCAVPSNSYPTVCYYADKVVLTEQVVYPVATPGGPNCNHVIIGEAWMVMPKSYLPFSVSIVARTL